MWLGLFDMRSHVEPDHKDDYKVREFMSQKYEKKRWYVAPTDAMHEEAKRLNAPIQKTQEKTSRNIGKIFVPKEQVGILC